MIRIGMEDFDVKIFEKFDKDWALLTAGDIKNRNTMTVSWGFMGTLYGKSVVCVFVRPNRHTYSLMESSERFTLSFMDESYRSQMTFMGRNSGALVDKYKETGLEPIYDTDSGVSYIKGAQYVMKLKKLYAAPLKEEYFVDKSLLKFYKEDLSDLHKMYIAEVTSLLALEEE